MCMFFSVSLSRGHNMQDVFRNERNCLFQDFNIRILLAAANR